MTRPLVVIAGPTASGKSALALALAQQLGGEIVNADSQQVYRGLDVGTGKPTASERALVPHHLYDVAAPWEQLDAAQYVVLADRAIADVRARGRLPIVVGGTGLWIRALLKGLVDAPPRNAELRGRLEAQAREQGLGALHDRLREVDPDSAALIRPTDPTRLVRALEVFELSGVPLSELYRRQARGPPRHEALQLALELSMAELEQRIRRRVRAMFDDGLVEETARADAEPRAHDRLSRVMGYREALELLAGRLSREAAVEAVARVQRQYAKRQRTWLRGEREWSHIPAEGALEAALAAWRARTGGGPPEGDR